MNNRNESANIIERYEKLQQEPRPKKNKREIKKEIKRLKREYFEKYPIKII